METAISYVSLPKKVPLGSVTIVKGRQPVRVISDPVFGDFTVYAQETRGLRFWWIKEPARLERLITSWKTGLKAKRALEYAGISDEQWESIIRVLPDIKRVKTLCLAQPSFGAMNTVQKGLQNDPRLAYTFLKDRGDLYTEVTKVGEDKPLQPSVNVAVQVNNSNEGAIEERVSFDGSAILSKRRANSQGESSERVAETVQG